MGMKIKEVSFVASFTKEAACPADGKPEFAFIGRSNVGKSSLINTLCNKKSLAKVSVTPGKTQLLNYFEVDNTWYLVDLPGYGYARTSKAKKEVFSKMIREYLSRRVALFCAFVLIDIRHPLQVIDRDFLNWCGSHEVPVCIVFTKADKLGKNQIQSNVQAIRKELLTFWQALPPYFITSSETKEGRDSLLEYIDQCMKEVVREEKEVEL
jgi:GTP-binding protein